VIVSPRNLKNDCCEIVTRDKSVNRKVKTDEVVRIVREMIHESIS